MARLSEVYERHITMETIRELWRNVKKETVKLQMLLDYEKRGLLTKEELERLSNKDPIAADWEGADKDWDGVTGNEQHSD